MAQMQLNQRLSSDQVGSDYVQALGEELQQAAKGDSWGASDGHDKGIYRKSILYFLFVKKKTLFCVLWLNFVFGIFIKQLIF